MIKSIGNVIFEAHCDKCCNSDVWGSSWEELLKRFLEHGWYSDPKGRKFKHLCPKCQTAKQKRLQMLSYCITDSDTNNQTVDTEVNC